jgi:hypothetical protein
MGVVVLALVAFMIFAFFLPVLFVMATWYEYERVRLTARVEVPAERQRTRRAA